MQHDSKSFILVHGAWDTARTWERLTPLLEALGHEVIALDLPGHGSSKLKIGEMTMEDFVESVFTSVIHAKYPVILVGHSMGGAIISCVGERVKKTKRGNVQKLVYVAGFLLKSGESLNGIDGSGIIPYDWQALSPDGLRAPFITDIFISPDRPKPSWDTMLIYESVEALTHRIEISEAFWGTIPRYYVKCTHDRALPPKLQQQMYDALPCVKCFEIESTHTPQRHATEELLAILDQISQN